MILDEIQKKFKKAEENQKNKFDKFNDFDYIFHSKLKRYDPNVPARTFNPILWGFIETIVTRMISKNPKIDYKPREESDRVQAHIFGELFDYWFDKSGAFMEISAWVKNALIYGTSILKIDWYKSPERMVKSYIYDENGEPIADENGYVTQDMSVVDYDDPRIKCINLYDFYFDPMATDIDNAKWVIHQYWTTIEELENENIEINGEYLYNKSALKRLKDHIDSSEPNEYENTRKDATGFIKPADMKDKIKVWEYWEDDKFVMVGDESEIIANGNNKFWHGKKPFIKLVDSIVPHEFYGKGEIEPVEKDLHVLNTIQNQRITNVNRILNPMWKAKPNVDDYELDFKDNGIIHVTDLQDAEFLQIPNVTGSAVQENTMMTESIQRALGVTDYVQGVQTPGQTAAEVQVKTEQANARFAHKVKIMEEMGLKRLGEFIYQLYQQFATKSKVIRVVGQQGERYVKITPADLVGDYDVIPESDSTLQSDQNAEFAKFLNLFQILQPYFAKQVPNPTTGQIEKVGFINEQEVIKELINRSGEKEPDRYLEEQNELPRQLQGAIPPEAGQGEGVFSQIPQGGEGIQGLA